MVAPRSPEQLITAERLRELLHYDPATGIFTWQRIGSLKNSHEGRVAGSMHPNGYIQITVDGLVYRAHRLVWLYAYGSWPPDQIDHINHRKRDNRIANLRLATQTQNGQNTGISIGNTSGIRGVCRSHWGGWRAIIKVNGKAKHLGVWPTVEEAAASYKEAALRYHGEFACPDRGERKPPKPRGPKVQIDLRELGLL